MSVLVNGEATNQISIDDRGLLYGQSVFETIAISAGRACLLQQHLDRLVAGAQVLGIPVDRRACEREVLELAQGIGKAVVRLSLTMGPGGRGYANPAQPLANRIVSLHDYPDHPEHYWHDGIELGLSQIKLAAQPALAGIKHGNRLEQIIARSQWQDNWQEALLLDQHNKVIEATQSNIFILNNNNLYTPPLDDCGVAGLMRDYVLAHANELCLDAECVSLSLSDIETAQAVFVCNCVIGVWPVRQFGDISYSDFSVAKKLLNLMRENGAIPSS